MPRNRPVASPPISTVVLRPLRTIHLPRWDVPFLVPLRFLVRQLRPPDFPHRRVPPHESTHNRRSSLPEIGGLSRSASLRSVASRLAKASSAVVSGSSPRQPAGRSGRRVTAGSASPPKASSRDAATSAAPPQRCLPRHRGDVHGDHGLAAVRGAEGADLHRSGRFHGGRRDRLAELQIGTTRAVIQLDPLLV